ncbi:MAG: exodeoxyribonuclease III [Rhodocyclaceae bacterium]|jgi:exodeoxyribonuclease-3|nr:exodeoxyribonuclease III [Rhodocyclaceae bacterium]MCA3018034.1 exodeoxyribonuclease III [Rhodocyclaceae bacterium]MCA3021259.1 exodeoxyribonuclease III [Rhodocyclaceae bacterium]MCA3026084.1 exodeoxyribonuclease III [Rhodocyclaceae bacterium]MCA3027135.1 exodeoxyribonuclease III [Rhodocyclaceae bacterium]
MRVISVNVNGIRSATSKGIIKWLKTQKPDVVCLQEIKALESDIPEEVLRWKHMHAFYHPAEKKGYAGVAVFSKREPDKIIIGTGIKWIDAEGRYLEVQFGDLSVVSLYVPSGSASEEAQAKKFRFMDAFMPYLKKLKQSGRESIIVGDWNIAHKEIDLKNWRGNKKNSGFLPEEREWLTTLFDKVGYIDTFRTLNDKPDQYTWWSNRGNARENNVGWRIDYHICTPGISAKATKTSVYTKAWFSDHAPLTIDYDYTL